MRASNRRPDQLRPITIERGVNKHAEGSALIRCGDTHVLCTASVDEKLPPFLRGKNQGWVTAEYGMLPRATHERTVREAARGKQQGRTVEIQRLIGRSLRAAVDLTALGERAITIDCDVLQADGGTRTASITGAYVALADAIAELKRRGVVPGNPLLDPVAAVSVGVIDGRVCLDLPYEEDSRAEVDLNVVMNAAGSFVEVQGTGEAGTFDRAQLDAMLDSATAGCMQLIELQRKALAEAL